MNKNFVRLITAGIILLLSVTWFYYRSHPPGAKVIIGNRTFQVDTAVTQEEKNLGLGGKSMLPDNRGMVFLFDHKEQYEFWMKGMLIPLDFIWIADRKVVDVTENVPAPVKGPPEVVKPVVPADTVLELNAGSVKKFGIEIGNDVSYRQ